MAQNEKDQEKAERLRQFMDLVHLPEVIDKVDNKCGVTSRAATDGTRAPRKGSSAP